jgi:urea transport system permease protein
MTAMPLPTVIPLAALLRFMMFGLISVALALAATAPAHAVDRESLRLLASDDFDDRLKAIDAIAADPDATAARVLQAILDGELLVDGEGNGWIRSSQGVRDALSGAEVTLPSPEPDAVMINNRLRAQIQSALAGLALFSADRTERLRAARSVQARADEQTLPLLRRAAALEGDPVIAALLAQGMAQVEIRSDDPALRLRAATLLGASSSQQVRPMLAALLERRADGSFVEPDERVRSAARTSLATLEARIARSEWFGRIFAGLSLGSILMLAAIGLAITYGLLGVINMAHGEMIMIGAYATFVTQGLLRSLHPDAVAWYPLVALPVAFLTSAAVGILLERTVIRWLYGRPLETLLATWGVSLILIQTVRQLFGPQNVEMENPAWLSGGWTFGELVLPYNRIAIIVFALAVLAAVALVLYRTGLGLYVRGVTQNRAMASAIGVPTDRIDMLAFGLGSGIAGLAGVALSQVGNVGPELGQSYIIDSFIVVVLGGVGQLMGTIVAGFGVGIASKLLEPWAGAVIAKILILALVIAFIQKRPSGLFALKGRMVEN